MHQYLLKCGFTSLLLSISPIAVCDIDIIYFFSVQCSANNRNVQFARPSGAGLNAAARACASNSPVILLAFAGVIRVFRFNADSIPFSEYVFRIAFTVVFDTPEYF
jgi:hypothetical protein